MTIETKAIRTREEGGVMVATLASSPLNLMGPEIIRDLVTLIPYLREKANDIRVVVFDSAAPDFFSAHVDMAQLAATRDELDKHGPGTRFTDLYHDISTLPQVTIATIAGRVGGAGSEFALSCDMRFASRERATFLQMEVGVGLIPGAGGIQHLPRLMGRGRALEVMLSADDYDADLAERYGWINRALPDAELQPFVDRLARRIATFPPAAITTVKRRVDAYMLPDRDEMGEDIRLFRNLASQPVTQARLAELFAKGMQTDGPLERSIPAAVLELAEHAQ